MSVAARRGQLHALASAALLVALAGLGGCSSMPRSPELAADAPSISGRLALQVAAQAQQPARSVNAQFELRGDGQLGELRLVTPLGTMAAQASWSPVRVSLVTPDGVQVFASVDALATEVLGEALPLAALFDWLRGQPWPGAQAKPSANGFEQLGWTIDLARWPEGWVQAQRAAAPAVSLRAIVER